MKSDLRQELLGIASYEKITLKRVLFIIIAAFLCIFVNYMGSVLAEVVVFPLYLDSLLTIGIASLCGLIPAIACAVLSNVVLSLFTHCSILFTVCHICTAVFAWLVFYHYRRKSFPQQTLYNFDSFLWAGFWAAITNAILGNIIADLVFAANTGRPSANTVVQGMYVVIPNLFLVNNIAGLVENFVDKILSALLSFCFYKAGIRLLNKL